MEKKTKGKRGHCTTDEGARRKAETQFGGVRGNPQCHNSMARNQRIFYAWVETEASIEELQAYADDESKPIIRRNFVKAMLKCKKAKDFFDLTNQTHGLPKQQIEITELPTIEINLEE